MHAGSAGGVRRPGRGAWTAAGGLPHLPGQPDAALPSSAGPLPRWAGHAAGQPSRAAMTRGIREPRCACARGRNRRSRSGSLPVPSRGRLMTRALAGPAAGRGLSSDAVRPGAGGEFIYLPERKSEHTWRRRREKQAPP